MLAARPGRGRGLERAADRRRRVRGLVVDYGDVQTLPLLREAVERGADVPRLVARRDHDGHVAEIRPRRVRKPQALTRAMRLRGQREHDEPGEQRGRASVKQHHGSRPRQRSPDRAIHRPRPRATCGPCGRSGRRERTRRAPDRRAARAARAPCRPRAAARTSARQAP